MEYVKGDRSLMDARVVKVNGSPEDIYPLATNTNPNFVFATRELIRGKIPWVIVKRFGQFILYRRWKDLVFGPTR